MKGGYTTCVTDSNKPECWAVEALRGYISSLYGDKYFALKSLYRYSSQRRRSKGKRMEGTFAFWRLQCVWWFALGMEKDFASFIRFWSEANFMACQIDASAIHITTITVSVCIRVQSTRTYFAFWWSILALCKPLKGRDNICLMLLTAREVFIPQRTVSWSSILLKPVARFQWASFGNKKSLEKRGVLGRPSHVPGIYHFLRFQDRGYCFERLKIVGFYAEKNGWYCSLSVFWLIAFGFGYDFRLPGSNGRSSWMILLKVHRLELKNA